MSGIVIVKNFIPLAHAYLIEGDRKQMEDALQALLQKEYGISEQGNPDFWLQRYGNFTIDDAREVKEAASKKGISGGKRIFIISTDSLTREAGNALLKTLEEPGENTHFFIIIPSISRILPTILSRVRLVKYASEAKSTVCAPKEFLALSRGERMKKIKDIMAQLEKEEITKGEVVSFIESLLQHQHDHVEGKNLKDEASVVSYSRDQSASLKMILEYLALTM